MSSLSTFSGHLAQLQSILQRQDGGSLMLVDEVGTGTDPMEGAALGMALLRRVVDDGPGLGESAESAACSCCPAQLCKFLMFVAVVGGAVGVVTVVTVVCG